MTNYHRPLTLPANRTLMLDKAFAADDSCMSVAGLAIQLGHFSTISSQNRFQQVTNVSSLGVATIARLIEFSRREAGLTREQYATKIGVGLDDLLITEDGISAPEPRVLYAFSTALNISYEKLMSLAGHRTQADDTLQREVLRFAASSGPMDKLSTTQSQALHDLLKILHE
jgi:hypothetical protein